MPPPPTGWPPAPARGAKGPTTIGNLATRPVTLGTNNCTTTFDEDDVIATLVDNALSTFLVSPWWNQWCGGNIIRIYPSAGSDHYHLEYTDPDIVLCSNPDNEFGTPVGAFARGADLCEPFDPVTEPRSYIHTMVGPDVVTIKNHAAKLCFKLGGPWEAALPPAEGEVPGTFCWDRLDPATYDLTNYTGGSLYVTVTLADPEDDPNFGIDTIKLNW